jgi:DNA segregation ATPase FtsK/SpoIIIE-like protein
MGEIPPSATQTITICAITNYKMTQTYLEKHVEELTNRVIILEKMVAHLLYEQPEDSRRKIDIPYPTPKRSSYKIPEPTDPDPLLDEAWKVVSKSGKASTSYLQRVMSLGYNRAAIIMDQLEREGVIGPAEGVKPREVLKQYPV